MTNYALIDATNALIRHQEFDGEPPQLAQAKGLRWLVWIDTPVPVFDRATHYLDEGALTITPTTAARTFSVLPLTQSDIDAALKALVPQSVTMRQARLALLNAGLLDGVAAAIAAMPSPQKEAAQIEWEYSQEVHRDKALVQMLAPALGLTDAQLDELFITASAL